jgi:hypothetical protein
MTKYRQSLIPIFMPEPYFPKNKVLTGKRRLKRRDEEIPCGTLYSQFIIEDCGMRDWGGKFVRV